MTETTETTEAQADEGRVPEAPSMMVPTPLEDHDLVADLLAGRREETFRLPHADGTESEYYVTVRSMTGVELDKYYSTGMDMSSRMPRSRREAEADGAGTMQWRMDRARQFQALVEASVVDYRLARDGKPAEMRAKGSFGPTDWAVFRELPASVKRWVEETIQEFQGIERAEAEGEA